MRKFEKYCKDFKNIENYDKALADTFIGWHCHHRRGEFIPTEELIASGMYYNRPAEELIFLTESEHHTLHQIGKRHTDETKKKIGEASKGNQYHKGKRLSEETKKKIGEKSKGRQSMLGKRHSEEARKKTSKAIKIRNIGRHWYNNGKENKFCYECPEGFVLGRK